MAEFVNGRTERELRVPAQALLEPVPVEMHEVPLDKLVVTQAAAARVKEWAAKRQGVFVHTFICGECGLHFHVLSWLPDRHTAANVICPECGRTGRFVHFRAVLSHNRNFELRPSGLQLRLGDVREIYQVAPWPGSVLLNDSRPPKWGESD